MCGTAVVAAILASKAFHALQERPFHARVIESECGAATSKRAEMNEIQVFPGLVGFNELLRFFPARRSGPERIQAGEPEDGVIKVVSPIPVGTSAGRSLRSKKPLVD
jgi:hypothetical protein